MRWIKIYALHPVLASMLVAKGREAVQRYYSFGSGNGSGGTILEARGLKDANKGEGRDNARRKKMPVDVCDATLRDGEAEERD